MSDDDYNYYLENLVEFKRKFGSKIYAYGLMTNHVHLLIDPGEHIESLGLSMKGVAGRQTRYVNKLETCSGSLWEGRYKSSIISSKEYLLACCRYIELNPLRAGMITDPAHYKWSNYGAKVAGTRDSVVDFPPSISPWAILNRNGKRHTRHMSQIRYQNLKSSQYAKLYREANWPAVIGSGSRLKRNLEFVSQTKNRGDLRKNKSFPFRRATHADCV